MAVPESIVTQELVDEFKPVEEGEHDRVQALARSNVSCAQNRVVVLQRLEDFVRDCGNFKQLNF